MPGAGVIRRKLCVLLLLSISYSSAEAGETTWRLTIPVFGTWNVPSGEIYTPVFEAATFADATATVHYSEITYTDVQSGGRNYDCEGLINVVQGIDKNTYTCVIGAGQIGRNTSGYPDTMTFYARKDFDTGVYSMSTPGQASFELSARNPLNFGASQALYVRCWFNRGDGHPGPTISNIKIITDISCNVMPGARMISAVMNANNTIKVTWRPSPANDATAQSLYRATAAGGPWSLLQHFNENTTAEYTDAAVAEGVTYFYKIVAEDVNSVSGAESNSVSALMVPVPQLISVSPSTADSGTVVAMTVNGAYLPTYSGAAQSNGPVVVRLLNGSTFRYCSRTLTSTSSSVDCTVDLSGLRSGQYDVQLLQSGAITATLPQAFTILPPPPFQVTALSFVPGSTLTAPPASIIATFSADVDPATVNVSTVKLLRAGPDGLFGTSDDVSISPTGVNANGKTVTIDLAGTLRPNDQYRLSLASNNPSPDTGIAGYWSFDEQSGIIAADSSVNQNNGSLVNSPTWITGRINGALQFNGSNSYVSIPNSPILGGDSFTLAAWIWRDGGVERKFLDKWNDNSGNFQFSFQVYQDSKLWLSMRQTNGVEIIPRGTTVINTGQWYHVAAVADSPSRVVTLYVNGTPETLQSNPNWDGTLRSVAMEMNIGRKCSSTDYWQGRIDDVRIYNRALSMNEIQILATQSTGIQDLNGDPLDGEPNADFPSGDGTPGGDFTATFTIDTPPPQFISVTPNSANVDEVVNLTLIGTNLPLWSGAVSPHPTVSFDGVNDSYHVPSSNLLNSPNFTIEAWVKDGFQCMKRNGSPYVWEQFILSANNGGQAVFWIAQNTIRYPLTSATSIGHGWTHLAATYDGTTQRIYINGVLDAQSTVNLTVQPWTEYMVLYAEPFWDNTHCKGSMSEFRFWKVARTQAQIAANMNVALTGGDPDLVVRYDFSNGGPNLVDTTGNGHSGTAYGSPTFDLTDGSPVTVRLSNGVISRTCTGSLTSDSSTLNCTINLAGLPAGKYDVELLESGNVTASMPQGFTILAAPVANNQTVTTQLSAPKGITLTASNPNNGTLTWTIVDQPAHGTLSGTAPNLTYTPDNTFTESDSFTFKANDGFLDTNIATVRILLPLVVTSMQPSPSGTMTQPSTISISFNQNPDPATVNTSTVKLVRAGTDGLFETNDDVVISPSSVSLNGNTITLDLTGLTLPNDHYRITLKSGKSPSVSGLVGHWTFNEGSGNVARDSSGNNHDGTLYNSPQWSSGINGGALNFTGTNYVEIPYSSELNSPQFTLSAWTRPAVLPAGPSGAHSLITSRDAPPLAGYIIYAKDSTNTGEWEFWTGNGITSGAWNELPGNAVVANNWIHITASYDGSTMRFYENGALVASRPSNYVQNTAKTLRIGAGSTETTAALFYEGLVSDVRIYNRALSVAEVASLADIGIATVGGNPLDGEFSNTFPSGDGVLGGDFTAQFTIIDPAVVPLQVISMSPQPNGTIPAPTSITVSLNQNADPATVNSSTVELVRAGPDGLFGTNDDVAITPTSISVNSSEISVNLTNVSLPSGRYRLSLRSTGVGLEFDANDVVFVPDAETFELNSFTLEAWVKMDAVPVFNSQVIFRGDDRSANDPYSLGINNQGKPYLRIDTPNAGTFLISSNTALPPSVWTHLAGTYDSGSKTLSLFVNGTLVASGITTDDPVQQLTGANPCVCFGNLHDLNQGLIGSLQDVRIWTGAHSQAQIQATMAKSLHGTETGLIGYWRLGEGVGQIARDSTANARHGTLGLSSAVGSDDPNWITGTFPIMGVADLSGALLDGEPNSNFPSGDGIPGGDFTAAFTVNAPPTLQITNLSPLPGTTVAPPANITFTFSENLDAATVNTGTVRIDRAGPDGFFGTADDISITPAGVSVVNGNQVQIDLGGVALPNDDYRVTLRGNGAVGWGGSGECLSFDGVNNYCTSPQWFTGTGNTGTVECWFKPMSYGGGDLILHKAYYNDLRLGWGYSPTATQGTIYLWFPLDHGGNFTASDLQLGQWYHIAGVYDGSNVRLYINGVERMTVPWSGSINWDGGYTNSYIGGMDDPWGGKFPGLMDEVRVWSTARTQAQIQASMNTELSGAQSGLLAYYKMNEGSGQVLLDSSGNARHARLGLSTAVASDDPSWYQLNPIQDLNGNALDGEPNSNFPSGNGTPGGDFTGTFTVFAPRFPQITSVAPDHASPNTIVNLTLSGNDLPVWSGNIDSRPSVSFDGVDDSYQVPSSNLLNSPNFTIEAWVKEGFQCMKRNGWPGIWEQFILSANGGGNAVFWVANNFQRVPLTSATPIGHGWTHLAATYDGSVQRIYINGVLDAQNTVNIPVSAWTEYMVLYAEPFWDNTHCQGSMSEFRFWKVARTQAQIAANMNTALVGNDPDLVCRFDFANGGPQLIDTTGNGHTGSPLGSPTFSQVSTAPVMVRLSNGIVSQTCAGTLTSTATNLNCTVDLTGLPIGKYDVELLENGIVTATLPQCFTILVLPTASDQAVTTPIGVAKAITLAATNPNNGTLLWTIVDQPAHGTLSGTAPNFTYTPNGSYTTTDSFTFKVNDGTFDSNIATVSISIPLQIISMSPSPGSTVAPPNSITVTLSQNPDPASVNSSTVKLIRAGADGVFGTADDVTISPTGMSVSGNTITLDLSGTSRPSDKYRMILNGGGTVPTAGLICNLKLDEGSGTTSVDATGNGNNATVFGGTTWATGSYGGALSFDGTGYATFAATPELNFAANAPFTISGWVNTMDSYGPIVTLRNSVNASSAIQIDVGYDGNQFATNCLMGLVKDDSDQTFAQISGGVINTGTWRHFALTRNTSGTIELFLDGVSQGKNQSPNSGGLITTDLRSLGSDRQWVASGGGQNNPLYQYLNGRVDEVRIYNRQLSNTEIVNLAGSAAFITDLSGNALDGEPHANFPSGDGNAGGDFTAMFTISSPSLKVTSMSVTPGSTIAPPNSITVTLSDDVEPTTINSNSVRLVRAGPDGNFGTADDVFIAPATISVNANVLTLDMTGVQMPADMYQLKLFAADSTTVVSFSGSGYVEIPGFGNNAPEQEITVEFWQQVVGPAYPTTFATYPDNSSNRLSGFVPWSDGVIYWDFGNIASSGNPGRLQYTPPTISGWQHFAFVVSQSGNFMKIYRNGNLEASKSGMSKFTRGNTDLRLGWWYEGPSQFVGKLAEFRVWSVARTQAQIQSAMNYRLTAPQLNLFAYYPLSEGAGGMVHDISGSGNSIGTFSGDPIWQLDGSLPITGPLITDLFGNALDGEPNVEFPSGNGSPGGDFTATFRVEDAPRAVSMGTSLHANTAVGLSLQGTDAANRPLTFTIVSPPAHGALSGSAPDLNYKPATGFVGVDSFTFKVNNGIFDSDVAAVYINVTNIAPTSEGMSVSTHFGMPVQIVLTGSDLESDPVTFLIVALPQHATLSGFPPNLIYVPEAAYVGNDTFTYKVNDGFIDSAVAEISISITNSTPAISASASPSIVAPGGAVLFTAVASDADGDGLSFHWDFGDGSSSNLANPVHSYSAVGTYTAIVIVSDGAANVQTALTIVVSSAPVIHMTTSSTVGFGGNPMTFDASASFDPENGALSYVWDFGDGSAPQTGVSVTKTFDQPGTYMVTLSATDAAGVTTLLTRPIEVLPQDEFGIFNGFIRYKVAWNRLAKRKDSLAVDAIVNTGKEKIGNGTDVALEVVGQRFQGTLDKNLHDYSNRLIKWQMKKASKKQNPGTVTFKLTVKGATLGLGFNKAGAVRGGDPKGIVSAEIPLHLEIGEHVFELMLPSTFKFNMDGTRAKGFGGSK